MKINLVGVDVLEERRMLSFKENEMINLMHGDCLELMKTIPDKSVDMVLTDPPYGMKFVSNRRKDKYKSIDNDNSLDWLDLFVDEAYRISKDNTAHYVFCSFHNIDVFKRSIERKFKVKDIMVWEKNVHGTGDLKGTFAPKIEFVIFLQKGRKLINGKRDPNIFKFNKTGNKNHPTEKPVDMIEYLLSKFSACDDIILDPFMGSGSTGVACVNTNRKFIGIEMDDKYFEIAKNRIENHTSQLNISDVLK